MPIHKYSFNEPFINIHVDSMFSTFVDNGLDFLFHHAADSVVRYMLSTDYRHWYQDVYQNVDSVFSAIADSYQFPVYSLQRYFLPRSTEDNFSLFKGKVLWAWNRHLFFNASVLLCYYKSVLATKYIFSTPLSKYCFLVQRIIIGRAFKAKIAKNVFLFSCYNWYSL